jgi:hypothetical protein
MASHDFDPGPVDEPFASLSRRYPGPEIYPPEHFRIEWGPIFHRGRLDGSARLLVLGQDPGQHECIARRCLVGEAGQRVQGFLHKLGLERSYVMVNAFLYAVYGQPTRKEADAFLARSARYRHRWLQALLSETRVEAVVAFGGLAEQAFARWRGTQAGRRFGGAFVALTHPTMPDASARPGTPQYAERMKRLLEQWNAGLTELDGALGERDRKRKLVTYAQELAEGDRLQIPEVDLPAGTPAFMRSLKEWASREGSTPQQKRATIVVRLPKGERPWE